MLKNLLFFYYLICSPGNTAGAVFLEDCFGLRILIFVITGGSRVCSLGSDLTYAISVDVCSVIWGTSAFFFRKMRITPPVNNTITVMCAIKIHILLYLEHLLGNPISLRRWWFFAHSP